MVRKNVTISKWLMSSGIDLETAAVITGLQAKNIRELRDRLERNAAGIPAARTPGHC